MLSFDCLFPRELNGVADLYQIECEMTSSLTVHVRLEPTLTPAASLF